MLRGSVAAGRAAAQPRAVGARRRRGDPGGDRLCRLADAERVVDAGVRGRLGSAFGRACSPGTWSKAASNRCPRRTRSRSTGPISSGWASPDWARAPKSASRPCGWRRSPKASARSPPRPTCSWTSTARAPTPARRRARRPISWCSVDRGADVEQRAQQSPRHARRRRGADARRIPRTQPLVLAVRHRRRRGAVRRRACSASSSAP